jgi:putative flavoprotein involved in K+ transport
MRHNTGTFGRGAIHTSVVIGAGHSGLAVSWHLRRRGVEHVVLEAGRVGESWRAARWDSFALNTPNWSLQLPGDPAGPEPRDGFLLRDSWTDQLEHYVRRHRLPVHTGRAVTSLRRAGDGPGFSLLTAGSDDAIETRSVVIASGFQSAGSTPAIAGALSPDVLAIHASEYRRADLLPPGGVLVVGSAQTGVQIAEDILEAGRNVFLSASAVARCPRRYRGRDIIEWMSLTGMLDATPDRLPDPRLRLAKQPVVSGVGRRGHAVSLQWLAARGVRLLGRLVAVEGDRLRFAPDLPDSIRFGDRSSAEIRGAIDKAITERGIGAPAGELEPADLPEPDPDRFAAAGSLDLSRAGIGTVIWATGFGPDLSWVDLPIAGPFGMPAHEGGRSPVAGVWFMGIPWMRTRKSALILGADDDARVVADDLVAWLG